MAAGPIVVAVEEHRTGPGADIVGSALGVVRSLGEDLADAVAAGRRALTGINT